ncbi:esterase [Fodinicurvata halophila]|uniref:Esterase n=1 Tax=Fodinicurvata halophila TaxID=1419723 RepID=A0ABV8UIN7_9PROT
MSEPLRLRDFGSFHVGGRRLELSGQDVRMVDTGNPEAPMPWDRNGRYLADQMYVQYLLPETRRSEVPVVFLHGGGLSGTTFETTPDGRPGWVNLFAHAGHDVYNTDAPERGRAGFLPYEGFRDGEPECFSFDTPLGTMRIAADAEARADDPELRLLPNCQFPIEQWPAFASRFSPFWLPMGQGVMEALEALQARIGSFVLLAHSAGCKYSHAYAERHPHHVEMLISVEPLAMGQAAERTRRIPQLVVWGDNIALDPLGRWPKIRAEAEHYTEAVSANGGQVEVLDLPQLGHTGNTHLPMLDRNSGQVARLILDWMERQEGRAS